MARCCRRCRRAARGAALRPAVPAPAAPAAVTAGAGAGAGAELVTSITHLRAQSLEHAGVGPAGAPCGGRRGHGPQRAVGGGCNTAEVARRRGDAWGFLPVRPHRALAGRVLLLLLLLLLLLMLMLMLHLLLPAAPTPAPSSTAVWTYGLREVFPLGGLSPTPMYTAGGGGGGRRGAGGGGSCAGGGGTAPAGQPLACGHSGALSALRVARSESDFLWHYSSTQQPLCCGDTGSQARCCASSLSSATAAAAPARVTRAHGKAGFDGTVASAVTSFSHTHGYFL